MAGNGSQVKNSVVRDVDAYAGSVLGRLAAGALTLKVRFDGNSRFYGGAAAQDDTTVGPREAFWLAIRKKRGGVRLLGESLMGRYIINSGTPIPQQPLLGDWHVSATGGYTVAQIDAAATASEAASGVADVCIFADSENDAAAGTAAATIIASITTYVTNRKAANPNGVVILCTAMTDSARLAGYAARNAINVAVNAGLPAIAAAFSGVYVFDTTAVLGLADINSTGNHPNGGGYNKWGTALAELVLSKVGAGGLPWPRAVQPRVSKARVLTTVEATDTAYALDDGSKGLIPQTGASFSFGVTFRPTTATAAYQRVIAVLGNNSGLSGNIVLLEGPPYAGATHGALQLYINGTMRGVLNDAIVRGRTHVIGVSVDRARGEASVYCLREGQDGMPETTLVSQVSGVAAWTQTFGRWVFAGKGIGGNGAPGLYGDAWVKPTSTITIDDMEAMYHEGQVPAGAIHYPLDDGSGTTPAPGQSFASYPTGAITGATWSAAGAVREPWHRRTGTALLTGAVSTIADAPAKAFAQSVIAALVAAGIAVDTTS